MATHVVSLGDGSWYGDYQVLLDMESTFALVAERDSKQKNKEK